MTNMKTTKRALLSSIVALFLCFAMLIGTTYAWFTDSATSANNIIKSGNLKINLEYWDAEAGKWQPVNESRDILTGDRWEPGYVDIAYFRISNAGTLALKYQLGVNIVSETDGVNMAGESFKLSDYIYFGVMEDVDGETAAFATREDAMRAVTEPTKISAGYAKAGELVANEEGTEIEYQYLAMVVYMPTEVGNVANHDGNTIPKIDLGVNIIATQMAAEWDSFGPDYDKDAMYADEYVSTTADLQSAINNAEAGDVIALMGDIDLTGATTFSTRAAAANYIAIPDGADVTINLNGYSIIGASTQDTGNQYAIQVRGNLTIVGEGTVSIIHTGADMGWNNLTAAISVEGGSLTLGEGVVVVHNGGSAMAYAVDVNSTLGTTTLDINGATLSSTYIGVRIFNNNKTAEAVVSLNSGVVGGGRRDIWVQNPSASAVDANAVVNIADSYNVTLTTQDASSYFGRIYDFDSAVVGSTTDLKNAINNNSKEIYLTGGEYSMPTLSGKEGVTIIGTADTVVGGENSTTGFTGNFGKNTTIKNVTFAGASNGVRSSYGQGGTVTFEDCTFAGDSTYGFHMDQSYGATLIFNNCTFSGFNAFASDLVKVEFNNCTFLYNGNYGHTNVWSVGEFNNCTWGDKTSVSQGHKDGVAYGTLYFDGVEESYHHEYIGTAESLFTFAKSVNEGNDSWSGQKVSLVADIDLENAAWTPIGQTGATQFRGIFDGNGYTISNLYIEAPEQIGAHYSAALFGWLNSATVKNVVVDGATVIGSHNVAVIAGYLETKGCTVSNCTVKNATITATHKNDDQCGDKVGVIVGHAGNAGVNVENCTAVDSTIVAGRDAGQIVGAALTANVVGCSADNVTVTAGGDCTGANINNALIGRVLG